MKLILALLLFASVGCNKRSEMDVSIDSLAVTIDRTQVSFYGLGRSCGVLALLTLQERERKTGQPYTVNEVYAYADSIAQMKGRIK